MGTSKLKYKPGSVHIFTDDELLDVWERRHESPRDTRRYLTHARRSRSRRDLAELLGVEEIEVTRWTTPQITGLNQALILGSRVGRWDYHDQYGLPHVSLEDTFATFSYAGWSYRDLGDVCGFSRNRAYAIAKGGEVSRPLLSVIERKPRVVYPKPAHLPLYARDDVGPAAAPRVRPNFDGSDLDGLRDLVMRYKVTRSKDDLSAAVDAALHTMERYSCTITSLSRALDMKGGKYMLSRMARRAGHDFYVPGLRD